MMICSHAGSRARIVRARDRDKIKILAMFYILWYCICTTMHDWVIRMRICDERHVGTEQSRA